MNCSIHWHFSLTKVLHHLETLTIPYCTRKSALSVQPYKLKHRVDTARVSKIAGESMSCRLDGVVYDAKICKNLCKDISQAITNQVKKFCPCR